MTFPGYNKIDPILFFRTSNVQLPSQVLGNKFSILEGTSSFFLLSSPWMKYRYRRKGTGPDPYHRRGEITRLSPRET